MRLSLPSACLLLGGLLSVGVAQAQPTPRIVSIVVANNGTNSDTLRIGLAEGATYGLDASLGEIEYPPFPPSEVFETRLINIPNHPTASPAGLGEGVKMDLRPYLSEMQTDTFRIKFQAGLGGYPVIVRWNSDELKMFAQNLTIKGGGKSVDMLTATTFTVDDPDVSVATIIRQDSPKAGVDDQSRADATQANLSCTPTVLRRGEALRVQGSALNGATSVELFDAIGARVRTIELTDGAARNGLSVATDILTTGSYYLLVRRRGAVAHASFVVLD